MGWGHFSTVWLVLSLVDKNLYALKIQKSAKKYTESAFDEEGILKVIWENFHQAEWQRSIKEYYHLGEGMLKGKKVKFSKPKSDMIIQRNKQGEMANDFEI